MSKTVKLVVFVPLTHSDEIRKVMGKAGAGKIGNYTHCSFSSRGHGRFLPEIGSNPSIGNVGQHEVVEEERIEFLCQRDDLSKILLEMKKVHPYDEVTFDVYPLEEI